MPKVSCPGCGAAAEPDAAHCAYCTRPLASVACGHCFARVFPGMAFCPSCGRASTRSAGSVDTVLACPGCAGDECTSPLRVVQVGEHQLHECLACHGLWLDNGTVERLERDRAARSSFAPTAGGSVGSVYGTPFGGGGARPLARQNSLQFKYRRCPMCASVMNRQNVARISGVVVDRCRDHGTFFDANELNALVHFWESGGLDLARSREQEALAAERRRLALLAQIDAQREQWNAAPRYGRRRWGRTPDADPPGAAMAGWLADLVTGFTRS